MLSFALYWKGNRNYFSLLNGQTLSRKLLFSTVEQHSLKDLKTHLPSLGEILAKDLRILQLSQGALLQYVDDLLIASPIYELCLENTTQTLNHLATGYTVSSLSCGFKVSSSKVQICKEQVIYLGFQLQQGWRGLMADQKKAIACT
jgi:hypothetical protein